MFNSLRRAFPSSFLLNDANALLYSAKTFTAAMLAYYIALAIGLDRPSWSIITVYIVSQTSVGASLSRSVYRLMGTITGAAMTVVIVPGFVNTPIICSLVLTGWITLCLYFSQLDRTPRAYAFVLAGYTASLIGFPAVFEPGTIFDIAITRVQEITIGILCASFIHRYVIPRRITGLFNSKLSATQRDARRMVTDTLKSASGGKEKQLQLALALQSLEGFGHHLPYDFAISKSSRKARQLIHDRLSRLLVLSNQLQDYLHELKNLPESLAMLVREATDWLACEDSSARKSGAETLRLRCVALQQQLRADELNFKEALQVNFVKRLQETILLLQQCEQLSHAILFAKPEHVPDIAREVKGYVYHRDHFTAARAALGAFAIIFSGCLLWIYSAWPDGATAVSILGVCCTLFGSFDTPVPHIVKYIAGSVYGVVISLLYSFILLPQVTEFSVLVAVLAPAYLLAGSLQARPPTTFMAMGITLTLPIMSELGARYSGDFASAINTAIALFAATGYAVVSMSLLQTVQADSAIRRLLHRCRRDIRYRAKGLSSTHDVTWMNLMIDRTALILPRLQRSNQAADAVLNSLLNYLNTGLAVTYLRRSLNQLRGETATQVNNLLNLLARGAQPRELQQRIDIILAIDSPDSPEPPHALIEHIVDLHCALKERDKKPDQEQTHDD
ncbi:FUSC family protein [Rahnella aquatilis]|uniref:Putative membrane protein n=3 Tax=Rahnella aquatilis TaxID=34038 RepID=H2IVK2_RAHAC|nr:FUSC family protein [Rahnella aquatilis]AEX51789.1 putative membrane protein [Rahnella aquatilis CIP 78.65 = ATCC 33071]